METWFFENLALVLGLAFVGVSVLYGLKACDTQSISLQEGIGIVVVFLIGGAIILYEVGLL